MDPIELVEMLYQVRGAIAECGKKVPIAKDSMKRIEGELVLHIRQAGHDPGTTAEHADKLKLKLMGSKRPRASKPLPPPTPARDSILECLEEAARVSGCEMTPHRVVGRWAEFVGRSIFGLKPNGTSLVPDDPETPVGTWVREHDVDTGDIHALAVAYLEWTREVCSNFHKQRRP